MLMADPPGTIMPLGGEGFGYKGFGFGIMVDAFALALSGHGRLTKAAGRPRLLPSADRSGGLLRRRGISAETAEFVRRCTTGRPVEGAEAIRFPWERAKWKSFFNCKKDCGIARRRFLSLQGVTSATGRRAHLQPLR